MKTIRWCLICLVVLALTTLTQCKKEYNPELPPATTRGAMTFGCLVDGKVFVPRDGRGQSGLRSQYVYDGPGPGGGWYLGIPATDWKPTIPEGVNIETDSLLLVEGKTYIFKDQKKGFPLAFYDNGSQYNVLDGDGTLTITNMDSSNRSLSGTFSFVATDKTTGKKVTVTQGRFDVRF